MSDKPGTKLTLKIKMFGTHAEIDELFAQLNEHGYLRHSEDITLVCTYWDEESGKAARDAAEELLKSSKAVMQTKSTTALTTKRPVIESIPIVDSDDDESNDDEELPLLVAIKAADVDRHLELIDTAASRFDDQPLAARITHLLRLSPMSVAELVEALHNPESIMPNPTADDVQAELDRLYEDEAATLELGKWSLAAVEA